MRDHPGAVATSVLVLLAAVCAVGGLLPSADLAALAERVLPVLGFVAAITVVAELALEAGLLDVIARGIAVASGGRTVALWAASCALAVVCTAFFSLDTTAVIMTPVVVLMAQGIGAPPIPFALATVWLANTASLLLPISNLTNLLARQAMGGGTLAFLARSAAPAAVAIVVPLLILALVFRRDLTGRFAAPPPPTVEDRTLLHLSAVVVLVLLPLLVVIHQAWIPATGAALVLLIAVAVRRPAVIRARLLPWQPLAIALALFVLVGTVHAQGLDAPLLRAADGGTGPLGLLRTAAAAAVSANVLDNLPAFLLLEPAAADDPRSLMALLIGVNAGVLVTPWASLATLLWHHRIADMGVRISWGRFMALGALAVVVTVPLATLALALVG
ncbi:arsenic transporter [Brachybacterium endophyticum]|uniref:Arsenic transporter n=2 Tax=Brachybacterium endophyticum TaxID=2182385 RepID=A0A2U2RNC2_9MICO|nr:arsenic transporter [Brachybacterium endophyticum]